MKEGGDVMKLKDFKDSPERYQDIKRMCSERGIQVDDDTDINEILEKNKGYEAKLRKIGFSLDRNKKCNE